MKERLIFDGEYLNGKRNGKGKEYNKKGKLIFEGEFKNNYRSKGKEYVNERLEFEGEYMFNKKWNGKGYDEKGNIIYELKNGSGKVKEYNKYGDLEFEGEYLNGIKWNGKGYKNNKIIYIFNQGKGFLKNTDYYNYKGVYFDEELFVIGKIEKPFGFRYEGTFKINDYDKDGYGRYYNQNLIQYEGDFKDNSYDGIGIYYCKNGDRYEGEFKFNKFNGVGTLYFKNGDRYEGEFNCNKPHGVGILYFKNGDRHEGEFKDGIYDGYGIFYSTLGFKCEGYFRDCLSTTILFIIYKIVLFFLLIFRNKMTLFLMIILIIGILINY